LTAVIPGVLNAGALQLTANGGGNESHSQASVDGLALSVAGIGVGAGKLVARANAACGSVTGSSEIADLTINGRPIAVSGKPNQTINLLLGKVIINEQTPGAGGIVVNALRVSALGVDVVVASAKVGISCGTN
jgi:hypothetical protein